MDTLIIYKSIHHGNTLEVIEEIADVLRADIAQIDVVDADMLTDYDLIGFGSGIYYGQHYKSILNFIRDLPSGYLEEKKVFIVSTSGMPRIPFFHNFEQPIREALNQKGASIIGSYACRGFDNYGFLEPVGGLHPRHPNNRDLQKARDFASNLYREHFAEGKQELNIPREQKKYSIF